MQSRMSDISQLRGRTRPTRARGTSVSLLQLCSAVAAALVLSSSAVPVRALEAGQKAPELSGVDLGGKKVSLEALRGRVVLVDFMASWCGPCKEELPVLEELRGRYGKQGFTVLGVSVDEKLDNLKKFLAQMKIAFSVVHDADKQIAKRFQPAKMPSSFLVDKDGVVRYVHGGFRKGDEKVLEEKIRALLR